MGKESSINPVESLHTERKGAASTTMSSSTLRSRDTRDAADTTFRFLGVLEQGSAVVVTVSSDLDRGRCSKPTFLASSALEKTAALKDAMCLVVRMIPPASISFASFCS